MAGLGRLLDGEAAKRELLMTHAIILSIRNEHRSVVKEQNCASPRLKVLYIQNLMSYCWAGKLGFVKGVYS